MQLAIDARSEENRKGNGAENPMEPPKSPQSPRFKMTLQFYWLLPLPLAFFSSCGKIHLELTVEK